MPANRSDASYTFGTDAAAAERLRDIALFFNPLAESWIRTHLDRVAVDACVDLGCGPGYTTDMLARATGATDALGLDANAGVVAQARARFPACRFRQQDVTAPLSETAPVWHCRFLLSHLAEPVAQVNRWLQSLPEGGWLFLDEYADTETDCRVFRTYIETNEALVSGGGGRLKVGPLLKSASFSGEVVENATVRIPVEDARVAGWLVHNARHLWPRRPEVQALLSRKEQQRVTEELLSLRDSGSEETRTDWILQRVVLRRGSAP